MRSLEVHLFENETDVDRALASGTILPEQLASIQCEECEGPSGYSGFEFEPFVLVIDENDQDWALCSTCAHPILSYVDHSFPPLVRSRFDIDDEDLDYF